MIDFAPPELAAEMVPRLLRGDETVVPGLLRARDRQQPRLARLPRRARTTTGWRVTGQKVWTSLAQFAQRCVLLTRTGTPESAHRGITALFVDMDTPGITRAPDRDDARRAWSSARSSSTTWSSRSTAPLGEEGQGWAVAMDLLPYERSTALWHRAAYLHRRLQQLLDVGPARRARPGRASARSPSSSTRSGPGHAPPSTAWPPASTLERRDVDRQGAAGHGRAGRVRPRRARAWPPR